MVLAQEAPRGEQDEMKETIVREWRGMTSLGVGDEWYQSASHVERDPRRSTALVVKRDEGQVLPEFRSSPMVRSRGF